MIRFAILICIFALSIEAAVSKPKKYNLSVCALFSNEAKNIREWIEYHLLVGVDHFYLYENGSSDSYMKVLRPYISRKIVTLVPWPDNIEKQQGENLYKWVLSTQVPAYENVLYLHAKKETNWLVFLNVDEFLLPVEGSLSQLLDKHQEYHGIRLESICFDASAIAEFSPKRLVIEASDLTKSPKEELIESVQKMIFKPEVISSSTLAPYSPNFENCQNEFKIDSNVLRINRYINRNKRDVNFRRKIVVDRRNIKAAELENIFNSGFDIEDEQKEIHRFIPEVTKRLSMPVK